MSSNDNLNYGMINQVLNNTNTTEHLFQNYANYSVSTKIFNFNRNKILEMPREFDSFEPEYIVLNLRQHLISNPHLCILAPDVTRLFSKIRLEMLVSDQSILQLPLSLLYLGTFLKKKGYEVELKYVCDEKGFNEIIEMISKEKPLTIGISALFDFFMEDYIALAKKIKNFDKTIPIIFGGLSASANFDLLLKEAFVDYVICGEGEVALWEFCEFLNNKRDIKEVRKRKLEKIFKQTV